MAKDQSKRPAAKKGPGRGWVIAVVAVALVASAGVYVAWRAPDRGAATSAETVPHSGTASEITRKMVLPAIPRRPRPATLAAETFTEPSTRKSYEIAKKNPDLLEQMACYCGCYSNPGHTNNLDCFVDKHGETWLMCRNIALEAQQQQNQGLPTQRIKKNIDDKYAR